MDYEISVTEIAFKKILQLRKGNRQKWKVVQTNLSVNQVYL